MVATTTSVTGAPRSGAAPFDADAVYRKVSWRIMPLLLISYAVAYIDRINVGYAQLQMKETLSFDAAVYGLGAGIFFLGYVLFELPSNLLLERIGARKTLLRIMFCWGLVAAAMMFVTTPTQFYILRFLLGVFEAGFFPGVILYLTYWYPSTRRAQMISIFFCATTLAGVIAGPMSGGIMKYMNGLNGMAGWQWLFVVQGLPATVLGVLAYFYLQDKPEHANWLSPGEKNLLRHNLEHDTPPVASGSHGSVTQMLLRDPKVYLLSLAYFLLMGATYTMVFWIPTLIKSWGIQDLFLIGLYGAVPSLFGVVGMVLVGRSSDRLNERRWHFMACACIAALGLGITTVTQGQFGASLAALSFAVIGIAAALPMFITITTDYLPKAAAAAGIALISSLGNLGSMVSPSITGMITARTGSPTYSMYLVMALYLAAGTLLLLAMRARRAGR